MVDEAHCVKHIIMLYLRAAQPQTRACVHTTVNNALCNCIPRMPRIRVRVGPAPRPSLRFSRF